MSRLSDYPSWIMGQTDYNLPVGLFCFKIQFNFFFFDLVS